MRVGRGLAVVVAVALFGCGGKAKPGSSVELVRLDLFGNERALEVRGVARVTVPAAARPVPALGGTLMATAYAGDALVAAVPIHLPTVALAEGVQLDGSFLHRVIPLTDVPETVFVPVAPGLDRIDVVDGSGAVRAHVSADRLGARPALALLGDGLGLASPASTCESWPIPEYPWIQFLGGESCLSLLPDAMKGGEIQGIVPVNRATRACRRWWTRSASPRPPPASACASSPSRSTRIAAGPPRTAPAPPRWAAPWS
jgi:hypothetical protein